jgi:hypothetical protein
MHVPLFGANLWHVAARQVTAGKTCRSPAPFGQLEPGLLTAESDWGTPSVWSLTSVHSAAPCHRSLPGCSCPVHCACGCCHSLPPEGAGWNLQQQIQCTQWHALLKIPYSDSTVGLHQQLPKCQLDMQHAECKSVAAEQRHRQVAPPP